MNENNIQPLISVVTVSYNAASTIEATILSVLNQTYPNIEYIIIDGGSKDGTLDIIKKYADRISYWISEPDKGIYDAMNKGIDVASGEWINFMNSGDVFYTDDVLENLANKWEIHACVIYGDTMLKYHWGTFEKKAFPLQTMLKHIPFSHQSCLIKTDVMKKMKYDLKYSICADYNFFYQLYQQKKSFYYIPQIIAVYEAESGVSSVNMIKLVEERALIRGITYTIYHRTFDVLLTYYLKCSSLIKRLLPSKFISKYYSIRHSGNIS